MTELDRNQQHPGYWPSPWPVECGGNRRQKAATGGLHAASRRAQVTTRVNGRWNVMAVRRSPGEWFVGGTMAAFAGPPPFGWVEKIDPLSLEATVTSPELPCGEHVWCGAILAHANGCIFSVNGSYLHRLDAASLQIQAERKLPADRSHNGLLALSDGTLVTKDLQLEGQAGTTVTRLHPQTLELVGQPLVLPEGSMGRIAADRAADGNEYVYVPGIEHVYRVKVSRADMQVEPWQPRYRRVGDVYGLAWDGCLSEDSCWLMDCGDITAVRNIHHAQPNGRFTDMSKVNLSWRAPSPRIGAQRLLRVDLADASRVQAIEPFGTPGGGIIAPPVNVPEHQRVIAWDSINGGLAGIDTSDGGLQLAWTLAVRPSMQPVVYPDSGELVINDFTDVGSDDLVVVDIASGQLLDRVSTGSRIANGMFLSPSDAQGVYYCTTTTLSHVRWL